MKVSEAMVSYCFFSLIITLVVSAYVTMEDSYGITAQDTQDGKDVGTTLKDLNIIQNINTLTEGVQQLKNPSSLLDILGGLLSMGIGVIGGFLSILSTPIEIGAIIFRFYSFIPSVVFVFIGGIIFIRVAFIVIEAYTGKRF